MKTNLSVPLVYTGNKANFKPLSPLHHLLILFDFIFNVIKTSNTKSFLTFRTLTGIPLYESRWDDLNRYAQLINQYVWKKLGDKRRTKEDLCGDKTQLC